MSNNEVKLAIGKIRKFEIAYKNGEITAKQFQSEFNDIIRNLPGDPGEGKITSFYTGVLIDVEGPKGDNVNSGAACAATSATKYFG